MVISLSRIMCNMKSTFQANLLSPRINKLQSTLPELKVLGEPSVFCAAGTAPSLVTTPTPLCTDRCRGHQGRLTHGEP